MCVFCSSLAPAAAHRCHGSSETGEPLHNIVITNFVRCIAYKERVGERSYIAQKSRTSIALVLVMQMGGGNKGMIDAVRDTNHPTCSSSYPNREREVEVETGIWIDLKG